MLQEILGRSALELGPCQGTAMEHAPIDQLPIRLQVIRAEDKQIRLVDDPVVVQVTFVCGRSCSLAIVGRRDEIQQYSVVFELVGDNPAEILFVENARLVEVAPVDRFPVLPEKLSAEDFKVESIDHAVVVEIALVKACSL